MSDTQSAAERPTFYDWFDATEYMSKLEAEVTALRAAKEGWKERYEEAHEVSEGWRARAEVAESERDALRVERDRMKVERDEAIADVVIQRRKASDYFAWGTRAVYDRTDAEIARNEYKQQLAAAEAKNQRLDAALRSLVADWRERARAVRPLETSPISSEKRERTKEWMFYTNRASEAEALLADPPSETGEVG